MSIRTCWQALKLFDRCLNLNTTQQTDSYRHNVYISSFVDPSNFQNQLKTLVTIFFCLMKFYFFNCFMSYSKDKLLKCSANLVSSVFFLVLFIKIFPFILTSEWFSSTFRLTISFHKKNHNIKKMWEQLGIRKKSRSGLNYVFLSEILMNMIKVDTWKMVWLWINGLHGLSSGWLF